MSISLQKEVWKLDLPPSEKLVLLKLADHVNDKKGDCAYPSVRSLANSTRLSERQIQRYLKGFVQAGFVCVEENGKGGRGKTKKYRFTLQKGDTDGGNEDYKTDQPKAVKGDTNGANDSPKKVTPTTVKGDINDIVEEIKGDTQGQQRVTPKAVKGDTFARTDSEPPKNHQGEPPTTRSMPRNGPAQILTATLYEDVLGIGEPTGYRTVVGQAQSLVKAGCSPDELRQIAEWLQADSFWATKGITMGLILSKRDNWRSASRASPNGQKPSARENDLDAWRRKHGLLPTGTDAIDVNGGPK